MSRQFTGEQFTRVVQLGISKTKLNFLFYAYVYKRNIVYPPPSMICSYPVRISKSLTANSDFLSVAGVLSFIVTLK